MAVTSLTYAQYLDMKTRYDAYYVKNKVYPSTIKLPSSMIADVTGAGMKSCIKCTLSDGGTSNGVAKGPFYKSTVLNYCPSCGKYGTITWVQGADYDTCGAEDNPGYEGMYVCCTSKGGCDADYCVCGQNHGWKYAKDNKLTIKSAATLTTAPITLAGGSYSITSTQMNDMILRVTAFNKLNGRYPNIIYIK